MPAFFSNNPFLRLIIPFLSGIIFAVVYKPAINTWPLLIGLFIILLGLWFISSRNAAKSKFIFLLVTDLFLVCFAIQTVKLSRIENSDKFYGKRIISDSLEYTFLASVNYVPVETGKFHKCLLKINGLYSDSTLKEADGNVIGYFRKGGIALKAGDELLIKAKLLKPQAPHNPLEFDYKKYLEYRQIHHTFFADTSDFKILELESSLSPVWHFGLKLNEKILSNLENSGLSEDAYSICAALLTGYAYDINDDVSEAFSHSGTLHVLSVSGLHTGLIYLCVIFLFDLFDRKKSLKYTRFFVVIGVLWFFALIAGFNAPVLRAVIMFSLLGVGKIFLRSNSRNQINILIATAFIMLCYNPFYIVDVGFQLSFVAVAGIFLFQPIIFSMYKAERKTAFWLWQSISTSLAATISTLPLTLFYFKQFPIWFFAANLVVVPVAFLLLILTFFVLLKFPIITTLVNIIVSVLIKFIDLFNSPHWGYIDNIDFRFIDALIMVVVLFIALYSYFFRSRKSVFAFFLIIILWQVNSLISSFQAKTSRLVSVYHIKKESARCVKNSTFLYINNISKNNFNYHVKPHLISFNYSDTLQRKFNFIGKGKCQYLILNKKLSWPKIDLSKITHLVIENNFRITEEDLHSFKNLQAIIIDGSNNVFTKRKLADLSSKFDITLYDTQSKGAYIASL